VTAIHPNVTMTENAMSARFRRHVIQAIRDHAPRLHSLGWARPIGRYIGEGYFKDEPGRVWDWVEWYIREHPEVLTGPILDESIVRAENTRRRDTAGAIVREAAHAWKARDHARALALLDAAEEIAPFWADLDTYRAEVTAAAAVA
jgi:hypothetical protein